MPKPLRCLSRSVGKSNTGVSGQLRKGLGPRTSQKEGWTWSPIEVRVRRAVCKAEWTYGYHEARGKAKFRL